MADRGYDCVIIGSGPNGLTAAAVLARAGLSTLVVEARDTAGGGCRSGWLTLPGFVHDHCSAVHPLGAASPVFRSLGLERHGLSWVDPPSLLAHVLPDGEVATLERDIDATAAQFGADADRYHGLVAPFVSQFAKLYSMVLGPLRVPSDPILMARFGLVALRSMQGLADRFKHGSARALLAGISAHAMVPLDEPATASFALVLALAGHAVGWPLARGGSQAIADALLACLRRHGGELELGRDIQRMDQLPRARAYLFDVTPRQLSAIAGERLPPSYRARLASYRYGPGVYKMDWALRGPIPWRNQRCARAGTVHLSGTFEDVAAETRAVHGGVIVERPFVLLVQPSLFDPTRAPEGTHVAWAYCHVPHGSTEDVGEAIEAHIERFAPGFKATILARASKNAVEMEAYNQNYVGGDINGGLAELRQLFFRPVAKVDPYATPAPDIFLCSSSTPPGGGVHGMCGYWAARSVLSRVFGRSHE
jgi:phytoene dehydrogenase-like protein